MQPTDTDNQAVAEMDEATRKAVSLLRFVREFARLRTAVPKSVRKSKEYKLELTALPAYENLVSFQAPGSLGEPFLRVTQPEPVDCPIPPQEIEPLLGGNWRDPKATVRLTATPERPETLRAFEAWSADRDVWVEEERKKEPVDRLFTRLYELRQRIQADGDELQLMVGNAIAISSADSGLYYPLLLREVVIEYEPENGSITVRYADAPPTLATEPLPDLPELNLTGASAREEELIVSDLDILDPEDVEEFTTVTLREISPKTRFLEEEPDAPSPAYLVEAFPAPILFVRQRPSGAARAAESLADALENGKPLPGHLRQLVDPGHVEPLPPEENLSIDRRLARANGEDPEILLAKVANGQQLAIADEIRRRDAVLVQGPPGTGKTHTIANLLGSFLAEGKRVLVTSQTSKALEVLREKLPEPMQGLCVSLVGNDRNSLRQSIDEISASLARPLSTYRMKANNLAEQREHVIDDLATVREDIFAVLDSENTPISISGISALPSEMARRLAEDAGSSAELVPDLINLTEAFPLSDEELAELYELNAELDDSTQQALQHTLPDPSQLPAPSAIDNLATRERAYEQAAASFTNVTIGSDVETVTITLPDSVTTCTIAVPKAEILRRIQTLAEEASLPLSWQRHVALESMRTNTGGQLRWKDLFERVERAAALPPEHERAMLGRTVHLASDADLRETIATLATIAEHWQERQKLSIFKRNNRTWKAALGAVTVDGAPIKNGSDCAMAVTELQLRIDTEQARAAWNILFQDTDMPAFDELDPLHPAETALGLEDSVLSLLQWQNQRLVPLVRALDAIGLPGKRLLGVSELDGKAADMTRIQTALTSTLPELLSQLALIRERRELDAEWEHVDAQMQDALGSVPATTETQALRSALRAKDAAAYGGAYQKLVNLCASRPAYERCIALLERFRRIAPKLYRAIREKDGIHGQDEPPEGLRKAWELRQAEQALRQIQSVDLDALEHKAADLSARYRDLTAELASALAWEKLVERTQGQGQLTQALHGWQTATRKIGGGTGKRAQKNARTARRLMRECQEAAPAWIMPMDSVYSFFDPEHTTFDVVIVDEASQSNLTALPLLFMGRKVIIVGDDRQVSPLGIGTKSDSLEALAQRYLADIAVGAIWDERTSLYDVANTTFQPLMLTEHFRSVPQIIGYSNQLSYDWKIRPMREPSSSDLEPAVISHFAKTGVRQGKDKVNLGEAREIAALIRGCLDQPEYKDKTFGAISLLGDDQVAELRNAINQELTLEEQEQHRVLVGNASNFQGDERDVVFLSLVDSSNLDGPVHLRSMIERDTQRYNVAASRAKDQLWIVHSFQDFRRDLQSKDLRRNLLEYAENPQSFLDLAKDVEQKADSPFEEAVAKALLARGYSITQQHPVGGFRIDIVVTSGRHRVALECDGERYHSTPEQVAHDMERQTILERAGWDFIRLRGSKYYRDPDGAIAWLEEELRAHGIEPSSADATEGPQEKTDLLRRVYASAERALEEHKDELHRTLQRYRPERQAAVETALGARPAVEPVSPVPATPKPQQAAETNNDITPRAPEPTPVSDFQRTTPATKPSPTSAPKKTAEQSSWAIKTNALANAARSKGLPFLVHGDTRGFFWIADLPGAAAGVQELEAEFGIRFQFSNNTGKGGGFHRAWFLSRLDLADHGFLSPASAKRVYEIEASKALNKKAASKPDAPKSTPKATTKPSTPSKPAPTNPVPKEDANPSAPSSQDSQAHRALIVAVKNARLPYDDKLDKGGAFWVMAEGAAEDRLHGLERRLHIRFSKARKTRANLGQGQSWYLTNPAFKKFEASYDDAQKTGSAKAAPAPSLRPQPKKKPEAPWGPAPGTCAPTPYIRAKTRRAWSMTPGSYVRPENQSRIQEVMGEIIRAEAPIERGRLFKETREAFGLREDRDIINYINGEALLAIDPLITHSVDETNDRVYVWDSSQDPTQLAQFRPNDDNVTRNIDEFADEELAAALCYTQQKTGEWSTPAIIRKTLEELGFTRPGSYQTERLLPIAKNIVNAHGGTWPKL